MARLQTVFNTTHAELDHWLHRERCLDWSDIVNTWIDGEMNALEEAMAVLRNCRAAVKSSTAQMDRNRIGGCG